MPTRTGKDPVGQAAWLRHERPEVDAAAVWLLDVPEYLTMRLTGRAVAGWDTAVLRWCTDNRDPSAVVWDPALARRCGLDVRRLPELVRPASVVGTVLPAVAADFGLPDGVRVVAGTGDTTAAAVGAGATEEYDAHLYVGTSAWLSCHVPFKRTDIVHNIASLPSVVPGTYWVATVQDVAGKAVDWLLDSVVYAQDGMLEAAPRPADALDRLNALAASAPPGCNGVVFTPWLNGERTPVDDPTVRGGWFNVSLSTDPGRPRAQRLRGHRAQHPLDARGGGAVHQARRARRGSRRCGSSAAAPARRCGARRWPTCCRCRCARSRTPSWPTPAAPR